MTPDLDELVGESALGDVLVRLRSAVLPSAEIKGWATVDLDRAQADRAPDLGALVVEPPVDDAILGARCRKLRFEDGQNVVLLEPSTEGPLAAGLARHGECVLALYLLVGPNAPERARAAGFATTAAAPGPFGAEQMVLTNPRDGPFLILAGLD